MEQHWASSHQEKNSRKTKEEEHLSTEDIIGVAIILIVCFVLAFGPIIVAYSDLTIRNKEENK